MAQELFQIECDIILEVNIEISFWNEGSQPFILAQSAIKQLCAETLLSLTFRAPTQATGLLEAQAKSMKLYEEAWLAMCNKIAFDCYRRPICFLVAPQLLAASLAFLSEKYLLRMAIFRRANHICVQTELLKLKMTSQEQEAQMLGISTPANCSPNHLQAVFTGKQVLQNDFGQEVGAGLCDCDGDWLRVFS